MEICNKSSYMHKCYDRGSESLWKFWLEVFWKMFPKSAELFSSSRLVVSLRVQVNFLIFFFQFYAKLLPYLKIYFAWKQSFY